ncbi:MAG: NifU family protein [Myxococcota bacterium]
MSTERDFEQLARDLERLESVTEAWSTEQQATVQAIRNSVEAIQVGAFRRLIRIVKEEPGGLEALKVAVQDPWVRGVLAFNGLLAKPEPTLEERVEAALESVRPTLASHEGNVELVRVVDETEVEIRLQGSCDGCTHSDITVRQGIETAIKDAAPTIERVTVVKQRARAELVQLPAVGSSPFAVPWTDLLPVAELGEGRLTVIDLAQISLFVTLVGGEPKAYRNACSHLGMPLDEGEVDGEILTCPFHGFQFSLSSGECLTAPEIQLPSYPVRISGERIEVQVAT